MEKVYIVRIQKFGYQIDHKETSPVLAATALQFAIDMCGEKNVFFYKRITTDTQVDPAEFLNQMRLAEVPE